MDPTAHLGKEAIHLGWLTVNLFLQLLGKHSRGINNSQICTVAMFVISVGFCT